MAHWINQGAALCLVALGLVACGVPTNSGQPATATAAASGAGSTPAAAPAESQRMAGNASTMTPCRQDFDTRDANGDNAISLAEWLESEKGKTFIQSPEAAFKARDANGDGRLDPTEYGCETPAPAATPNGRG